MQWQAQPSQVATANKGVARGRGISFVHYKHSGSLMSAWGWRLRLTEPAARSRSNVSDLCA